MSKATATAAQTAPVESASAPAKGEALGKVELSKAQQAKIKGLPTVSARIRYLRAEGFSRSETARAIPNASGGQLRYQHVNNVWNQKAKAKTA